MSGRHWSAGRLPERKADEPIRAYKQAWLSIETNLTPSQLRLRDFDGDPRIRYDYLPMIGEVERHFAFLPLNHGPGYGVEAHAVCTTIKPNRFGAPARLHKAPKVGCSCGFYAYKQPFGSPETMHFIYAAPGKLGAFLEVELAGRVIVHSAGYRAEYQRVMQAVLTGTGCQFRTGRDMHEVTTFGDLRAQYVPGAWQLCEDEGVAWVPDVETVNYMNGGPSTPMILCARHANGLERRGIEMQPLSTMLDVLRADLPTDWKLPGPPRRGRYA